MSPGQEAREAAIRAAIPQAEHQRMTGLGRYEQMQIRVAGILAAEERAWTGPGCHEARVDRYLFWSGITWVAAFLQAYGFDLSHEALEQIINNHKLTQGFPVARTFDDCRAILAFKDKRDDLDRLGDPPPAGTAPSV